MKKIWIGLGVLLVVLVVAVIAVPFLVPVDVYKDRIVAGARDATGRDLAIGGIEFSLFPRIELEVEDVAFANAPGAATANMVELEELQIHLKFLPLLSGEVAIDSFVLVDPVIHLEVDKTGRPNWVFGDGAQEPAASGGEGSGGPPSLSELSLGDIRLDNGSLTFLDARSGEKHEVSQINMALALPDLDSPFAADGKATWNGETITLKIGVEAPRKLMSGRPSAIDATVTAKPVSLGFKGAVALAEVAKVEGDIDLKVPSVRGLAAWTGNPIEPAADNLGPMSIKGKLTVDGPQVSFADARMALDAITAAGSLLLDAKGAKPFIKGRLDVDRLDLNPYLPEGVAAEPEKKAEPGWSDAPIDVSGLKAVNAEFDLSVDSIAVKQVQIGKGVLEIDLKDGKLVAGLKRLALYGGNGEGRIVLDGGGKTLRLEKTFKLAGVQAEPLLRDAADFGRLSGTLSADIAIKGHGGSERAIVGTLNGKGGVNFLNGAITGINLAAMVRNVSTAFLDSGADTPQKTDFAELSATYTMAKGIVTNKDLSLQSPLLRVSGAGTVDLPKRTVDYRIEPKVAMTTEGQGGDKEAAGIMVPVIVEGPWSDVSYRPDLAALVKQNLGDPTKVIESVTGALPVIGKPKPEGQQTETPPANPLGIVKGLFGGSKP
jgi:AsmA protein